MTSLRLWQEGACQTLVEAGADVNAVDEVSTSALCDGADALGLATGDAWLHVTNLGYGVCCVLCGVCSVGWHGPPALGCISSQLCHGAFAAGPRSRSQSPVQGGSTSVRLV